MRGVGYGNKLTLQVGGDQGFKEYAKNKLPLEGQGDALD
jgi:hypothetical protein